MPARPPSTPEAPVFETDVRPIFTDRHREMMLPWFDLHSYADVRRHHANILTRLRIDMPCEQEGGLLPPEQIATFAAWIAGGFQTTGGTPTKPQPPDPGTEPRPPTGPGSGFETGPYKNHRWQRTGAPPAGRYDDIWHLDKDVGWAVNTNGSILATRDGWKTFQVQKHLEGVHLRCIGFANNKIGWVGNIGVVNTQRLLVTRDGGANWTFVDNLPSDLPRQICGLHVVDENVVYLAGSNENETRNGQDPGRATVLKTTDGGRTWTEIDMVRAVGAKTLIDVYFEDVDHGWIVGGVDTVKHPGRSGSRGDLVPGIFRTRDGGATWTNVVEGTMRSASGRLYVGRTGEFAQGEWGWKLQRIDADTIVVCVQNYRDGIVLRSEDDGNTWTRLRLNDKQRNSNLEGIGFLDRMIGWVGGWGDISYQSGFSSMTLDGGRTWVDANFVGNRINRFRVVGTPPHTIYASGDTIYKFSDEPLAVADAAASPAVALEGRHILEVPVVVPEGTSRLAVRIWERDGYFVRLLIDEADPTAGPRTIIWDFTNTEGARVEQAAFIVRVTMDDVSRSYVAYQR